MKLHPYCSMLPDMSTDEFSKLKDSIRRSGLLVPITILGDEILDGRHRWQVCKELGITPITTQYKGDDPFGYSVSMNATRRHLNTSQRAMLAANMANLKRGGRHNLDQWSNSTIESTESAAQKLNVAPTTVKAAKRLRRTAPASVIKAVEAGVVTLNAAQKTVDIIEPELLTKATSRQIEELSKIVGERIEAKTARLTSHAEALLKEYKALSILDDTVAIEALIGIDFYLGQIGIIRNNLSL